MLRAVVITVMNLWASLGYVSFSRRSMLRGVKYLIFWVLYVFVPCIVIQLRNFNQQYALFKFESSRLLHVSNILYSSSGRLHCSVVLIRP
jgi:hypothetical protein